MVRCEDFYKQFKKRGNFCGKSDMIAKRVEDYIGYVERNKIGTYKISNCALEPFMNIEFLNSGMAHRIALKELKSVLKKQKLLPEKITRRISIEMINRANMRVGDAYKLENIPGIRSRMGEHEHEIGSIGYDARNMFDTVKQDLGLTSNDTAIKVLLEMYSRDLEGARKIKEEIKIGEDLSENIEIVKQT